MLRVLVEANEQDPEQALPLASGIGAVLDRSGVRPSILLEVFDVTWWDFVALTAIPFI